MQKTSYGITQKGTSHFIIVAPHGIDDLYTADVANHLAELLDASLLVNDAFVKPVNPIALEMPEKAWDFNKLPNYTDIDSCVRNIECE